MATGKKMTERESLQQVYLCVVDNWAMTSGEIADATGMSVSRVSALLRKLKRVSLLAGEHVNGERQITWQSYYSIQDGENRADAERDFAEAFPGEPETKAAARAAGGGPRYSEDQLKLGTRLTLEGKTAKEVAKAVGVKSPNYFRKVVRARIEAAAVEVKKAAKARGGLKGRASSKRADRVVKRVRKDDGPADLKDLLNLKGSR